MTQEKLQVPSLIMLANVKIIKILEHHHRQTLSLVEKKYHLSCKEAGEKP